MLIQRAEVQQKGFKAAREYENVGFQWTRRIIALTAVFNSTITKVDANIFTRYKCNCRIFRI